MRVLLVVLLGLLLLSSCSSSRRAMRVERKLSAKAAIPPKREFRGAWIQTMFQGDYRGLTSARFRSLMSARLDRLRESGINAIIFQVRPEADAFYASPYEPWSRFLSGDQGIGPDEVGFDPMRYLIESCHARGMEFHAWINPYRAGAVNFERFAADHIYRSHPEWFVRYNGQLFFDPGLPECRAFIVKVVSDIVTRYDVDAIHMDDYFYPYPVGGLDFPDDGSFLLYGGDYLSSQRGDWRRFNVNELIQDLSIAIKDIKPWVRFGISPFGIYRNKSSDRHGSATNGLQTYDDLYADVLLWLREGWIDYCAPQLYWELGHDRADYAVLLPWWDKHTFKTPLYIGQDVARTMKAGHLTRKLNLARTSPHVQGNIFWPANELLSNNGNIVDTLRSIYHRYPALIPAYTNLDHRVPGRVKSLRLSRESAAVYLHWEVPYGSDLDGGVYYVIYRFPKKGRKSIERPESILGTTRETEYLLPDDVGQYIYYVTAVDRYHNEGKRVKAKKSKLSK